MVLLRFMSKSNADEFYLHFNNKPVCCRCRLNPEKGDAYFADSCRHLYLRFQRC